jgi:hypothetical protein
MRIDKTPVIIGNFFCFIRDKKQGEKTRGRFCRQTRNPKEGVIQIYAKEEEGKDLVEVLER